MQTFADAVALRMTDFCFAMFNVLQAQVQLVFMMIWLPIKLGPAIRQYTHHRYFMLFKEWQDLVVQYIGRSDRMLAGVELSKSNARVSIDESLLINSANTFDGAHVIGILRTEITRMDGFDLTMSFLLFFLAFQRNYLSFGKNNAFLCH